MEEDLLMTGNLTVGLNADTDQFQKEMQAAAQVGRQFARLLTQSFEGVAVKGKSVGDVFKSLALDLSKLVVKAALRPLESSLGDLFAGLFSGARGFSHGGVLQQGTPVPFAKGGVISNPIAFPLGRGGVGVAGEAGAEAIIPLRRGADGRLGVAASGVGQSVSVTMNISTPDVDGFQRSQTQVAARLARAVTMGQRNL